MVGLVCHISIVRSLDGDVNRLCVQIGKRHTTPDTGYLISDDAHANLSALVVTGAPRRSSLSRPPWFFALYAPYSSHSA